MESAHWIESDARGLPVGNDRVYIGHETCFWRSPAVQDIERVAKMLRDAGRPMTLVTPFLTEAAFGATRRTIEAAAEVRGRIEVVCNDWGLLHWLAEQRIAEPVVGRWLGGQATDPRLAAMDQPERHVSHERTVLHADGTRVALRYRRPSSPLMEHLRRCAVDTPEVLVLLREMGVRRLEISNVLQGVHLALAPGWSASLYLPDVPVAVSRRDLPGDSSRWLHPSFPAELEQRDNVVGYNNGELPRGLPSQQIDRVVWR
jgi:hypothetical protein